MCTPAAPAQAPRTHVCTDPARWAAGGGLWLRSRHIQTPRHRPFSHSGNLQRRSRLLIKLLACKTNGELVEDPCPVPLKEGPSSDSC